MALIMTVALILLWLIAAHDKSIISGECGGCVQLYHDALKDRSGDLIDFYKQEYDPYPLLVTFGVVCGLLWVSTGASAFVSSVMHLCMGTGTFMLFVVVFAIIMERFQRNLPCTRLAKLYHQDLTHLDSFRFWGCKTKGSWYLKHGEDSYEFFRSTAFLAFFCGAFQIATAIYLLYHERSSGQCRNGNPEANAPLTESPLERPPVSLPQDRDREEEPMPNNDMPKKIEPLIPDEPEIVPPPIVEPPTTTREIGSVRLRVDERSRTPPKMMEPERVDPSSEEPARTPATPQEQDQAEPPGEQPFPNPSMRIERENVEPTPEDRPKDSAILRQDERLESPLDHPPRESITPMEEKKEAPEPNGPQNPVESEDEILDQSQDHRVAEDSAIPRIPSSKSAVPLPPHC